ncbi:hypothetical protein INR49_015086 [Caranx melampygus]|nr:hypothetical protein INR49_015086 [Caranx melampygus]
MVQNGVMLMCVSTYRYLDEVRRVLVYREKLRLSACGKIEIERAHQMYTVVKSDSKSTNRTLIFKLLRYSDRNAIMDAYRAAGSSLIHEGHKLLLFANYSPSTSRLRKAFATVMFSLCKKGIQLFIYPAKLMVAHNSRQFLLPQCLRNLKDFSVSSITFSCPDPASRTPTVHPILITKLYYIDVSSISQTETGLSMRTGTLLRRQQQSLKVAAACEHQLTFHYSPLSGAAREFSLNVFAISRLCLNVTEVTPVKDPMKCGAHSAQHPQQQNSMLECHQGRPLQGDLLVPEGRHGSVVGGEEQNADSADWDEEGLLLSQASQWAASCELPASAKLTQKVDGGKHQQSQRHQAKGDCSNKGGRGVSIRRILAPRTHEAQRTLANWACVVGVTCAAIVTGELVARAGTH